MMITRYKTIVLHITNNGAYKSLIYELVRPLTFTEAAMVTNGINSVFALETTEGLIGVIPSAISVFELDDPVIE